MRPHTLACVNASVHILEEEIVFDRQTESTTVLNFVTSLTKNDVWKIDKNSRKETKTVDRFVGVWDIWCACVGRGGKVKKRQKTAVFHCVN